MIKEEYEKLINYNTEIFQKFYPKYPTLQLGFFTKVDKSILILGQNPGMPFNVSTRNTTKNVIDSTRYVDHYPAYMRMIIESKIGLFLQKSGIDFAKTSFTNIVKIPTLNNAEPDYNLISIFKPITLKQIEYAKPAIIITLGAFARNNMDIKTFYHQCQSLNGYLKFACMHPSYYMRTGIDCDIKLKTFLQQNGFLNNGMK